MPNQITATLSPVPTSVPTDGWKIQYRKKGTTDLWWPQPALVFTSYPTGGFVFSDSHYGDGTLYEVAVVADCGAVESTPATALTGCDCPTGYTATLASDCQQITTTPATVLDPTSCLATTGSTTYSSNGTKIYKPSFNADTLYAVNDSNIEYKMITKLNGTGVDPYQWINISSGNATPNSTGPLNRVAVGIDTDCNGTADIFGGGLYTAGLFNEGLGGGGYTTGNYPNTPLSIIGTQTGAGATADIQVSNPGGKVVSFNINNPGHGYLINDRLLVPPLPLAPASGSSGSGATYIVQDILPSDVTIGGIYNNATGAFKTIYVGIGGSQDWVLKLNGNKVVSTKDKTGGSTGRTEQYSWWHIIPVVTRPGMNYFSVITTFSAATINGIGIVAYDNTSAQISAATNDSQLNIIFTTKNLRGTSYAVVEPCDDGSTLYVHAPSTQISTLQYDCVAMILVPCNGNAAVVAPDQQQITWEYGNNAGSGGTFKITINNQVLVNATVGSTGILNVNVGDVVKVEVRSPTGGDAMLDVTGSNSYNSSTIVPTYNTYTFTVASNDTIDIQGYSNAAPVSALIHITFENIVPVPCQTGSNYMNFDIVSDFFPTTVELQLQTNGFFSWSYVAVGKAVSVSATISTQMSPPGPLPLDANIYLSFPYSSGANPSISASSPSSIFVAIPVGYRLNVTTLCNIQNSGIGPVQDFSKGIFSAMLNVLSVNGDTSNTNSLNLCTGYSTS